MATSVKIKEQISFLRNEECVIEDIEISGRSNKVANLKCHEGQNNPVMQKDPMTAAEIYLENSKLENDENQKYISLMPQEESGLIATDNNHSCSSAVEQIENALKTPEVASVNNPDFGENIKGKNNFKSLEEQINSFSGGNIMCLPVSSISDIQSEGRETITTANDSIEMRIESSEDVKSSKERNISPSGTCSSYCPVSTPSVIQKDNGNLEPLEGKCNSSLQKNDPSSCIPFTAENSRENSVQSASRTIYTISSFADVYSIENKEKETSITESVVEAHCEYLQSKSDKESYTEDNKDLAGESSSTKNKRTKLEYLGEKSFPMLTSPSDIQARNANFLEDTEINERTNIVPPKGEASSSPFKSDNVDSRS